jgi:cytochrome c1
MRNGRCVRTLARGALLLALGGCIQGEPYRDHAVPGGDAGRGERLIARYGCGSCHTIPGVAGATAMVGPPLTDWSERQYIAGTLVNEPENLIRWIRDPDAIEPGTVMPNLGLSEAEARDVAAYLYTLGDTYPLGPPHLLPARWLQSFLHPSTAR